MPELVAGAPCGSHTQLGRCQKTAQSNDNIHRLQTNEWYQWLARSLLQKIWTIRCKCKTTASDRTL